MCISQIKARHVVVFWSFWGFFMSYMLRVNLSVALVVMVNSSATPNLIESDECPTENDTSHETSSTVGEFGWDETQQGILLGAFFWGYLTLQVPGGYLAERFGAKWLFGAGMLLPSLLTILTPLAARWNLNVLIILRVLMGVGEAVTYPAMHALLSQWGPPLERSKLLGIAHSGMQIGTIAGLSLTGFLSASNIAGGWPSAFYFMGAAGVLWFICWALFVFDSPATHPRIDPAEQKFILRSIGVRQKAPPIPWCQVLRSLPCWAVLVAHVAHNWTNYTILTSLPSFFAQVLHFNIKENGLLGSLPYICEYLLIIVGTQVADRLRKSKLLSTGAVRKLFNSAGFLGAAASLLGVGFVNCNVVASVFLLCLGMGSLGVTRAGYPVNQLDITPQFAGTLAGITNTMATIPGIVAPYIVGALTQNQNTMSQWRKVFFIAAGINFFGMAFFATFSSGKVQKWTQTSDSDETEFLLSGRKKSVTK